MVLILLTAAILSTTPAEDRAREARNRKIVEEGLALCESSKCQECGRFGYFSDGTVYYDESRCERDYQIRKAKEEAERVDAEIRAKYGRKP